MVHFTAWCFRQPYNCSTTIFRWKDEVKTWKCVFWKKCQCLEIAPCFKRACWQKSFISQPYTHGWTTQIHTGSIPRTPAHQFWGVLYPSCTGALGRPICQFPDRPRADTPNQFAAFYGAARIWKDQCGRGIPQIANGWWVGWSFLYLPKDSVVNFEAPPAPQNNR